MMPNGSRSKKEWLYLCLSTHLVRVTAAMFVAMLASSTVQSQSPDVPKEESPGTLVSNDPAKNEPQGRQGGANSVTVIAKNRKISDVIHDIVSQAKLQALYDKYNVLFDRRITVRVTKAEVMDAFATVLEGTGLVAKLTSDGETVMIRQQAAPFVAERISQAVGNVSGKVIDSITRKGIGGATVAIAGTKLTGITTADGQFTIRNVPLGNHTITVKCFGYKSTSSSTSVTTDVSKPLSIMLASMPTALTEVVTTATGTQERVKVGNDIAKINVPEVLKNAPVTTMSELLSNRVPGLIVQKTSGAAGAPSVIRIRGVSSVSLNNDPMIIVDGVVIYSTVSEAQDGSIVPGGLAPSPLDAIDPNSVETIEVMRGPSAAALYGTDAANGIIVVTTKRGQAGPARWRMSTQQGTSSLPGSYPLFYRLWGRDITGKAIPCVSEFNFGIGDFCMMRDSMQSWQVLNDSRTTLFGRGSTQNYSVGIEGGTSAMRYAFTVSTGNVLGYEQMPRAEFQRLEQITGNSLPFWQRRPNGATTESGSSRITVQLNADADVTLTSNIGRQVVRTTPLVEAINRYFLSPDPSDSLITLQRVPGFRDKGEARRVNSLLALNGNWRPYDLMSASGSLGWDRTNRNDDALIRRGDCPTCIGSGNPSPRYWDDLGHYRVNKTASDVISANVRGSLQLLRWWVISGPSTIGFNYKQNTGDGVDIDAKHLAVGGVSFVGADSIRVTGSITDARVAGFYVDQRLTLFNRYYTGFGFRFDRGSGIGSNASAPAYPKLDFSIPLLTNDNGRYGINALRIRTAFGHSGRQPGIEYRLRTFQPQYGVRGGYLGLGTLDSALDIKTIGNTKLRPERSVEWEGGMELSAWNDRVNMTLTGYRKFTHDMIISVDLPLSVYGGGLQQQKNIGNVVNRGVNGSLSARVLETKDIVWSLTGSVYANRNRLVSFSKEMKSSGISALASGASTRGIANVEGYPLNGYWSRPLLAYADADQDGFLSPNEIRVSDSAVFLGSTDPTFDGMLATSLGLFRGRVNLQTTFNIRNGMVQANSAWLGNGLGTARFSKILNDTTVSPISYARVLDGSAFINRTSSVRWDEFSISIVAPERLARFFRGRYLAIALQGQNLRLWTNYSGKDPNVGGGGVDNGQLPPPRTWMLRVDLNR